LASHWRVRHVVDERLHEIDFGAWEGRTWSDIERHDDVRFQRWMAFWKSEKPTGGESVSELEARVTGWLSERALEGTSGASTDRTDLVLIGHAGVIRALRVLCEGLDWDTAMSMATPHVTWSSFVLSPKRLEEIRSESQVR
jgi:alpha-ribazole phosphatase